MVAQVRLESEMVAQVRIGDGGWEEVTSKLATGRGPDVLNLSDCWLDEQQVFSTSILKYSQPLRLLVGSTSWHLVQQVAALEQVSYYELNMEEGEVNDNTIKLTRAVNLDLTPAV